MKIKQLEWEYNSPNYYCGTCFFNAIIDCTDGSPYILRANNEESWHETIELAKLEAQKIYEQIIIEGIEE